MYEGVANSAILYALVIIGLVAILGFSYIFFRKSYQRCRAFGMDKTALTRIIRSSLVFSVVPSISIVIGLFTLSAAFDIPWPWWRLSVIGSVGYELMAGQTAAAALGGGESGRVFVAVMFAMTLGVAGWIFGPKIAEVDQGTPEGDAVSAMAISASSMITVVIIAVGVLFIVPLQPILTIPAVKTATNYMLPALFGTFLLGFFVKEKGEYQIHGKLKGAAIPFILGCIGAATGVMIAGMQGVFILIMLPITILCNRILFKKGVVSVQKNPNYVPLFQQSSAAQSAAPEEE